MKSKPQRSSTRGKNLAENNLIKKRYLYPTDWTLVDRERLLTALRVHTIDNIDALQQYLPHIEPCDIRSYIMYLKRTYPRMNPLDVPENASSAPIESWMNILEKVGADKNDLSQVLGKVMECFSEIEEHPEVKSEFDPDYKAIYKYLSAIIKRECPPNLRPIDASLMLELQRSLVEDLKKADMRCQEFMMKRKFTRMNTEHRIQNRNKADGSPSKDETPDAADTGEGTTSASATNDAGEGTSTSATNDAGEGTSTSATNDAGEGTSVSPAKKNGKRKSKRVAEEEAYEWKQARLEGDFPKALASFFMDISNNSKITAVLTDENDDKREKGDIPFESTYFDVSAKHNQDAEIESESAMKSTHLMTLNPFQISAKFLQPFSRSRLATYIKEEPSETSK